MLRSIRLGEADRVLHVYTQDRGRVGAVAKGVRRTKSRFGARLEPLSHVELMLHQGSGELQTVTGVELIRPHSAVREDSYRLGVGWSGRRRRCGCSSSRRQPACIRGVDAVPGRSGRVAGNGAERPALDALALSFQLKLLWLSGYLPHLTSCAECGATDALAGYSPRAGGAVCVRCAAGALPLSGDGIRGIEGLLGAPLADAKIDKGPAREALGVVTASYEYHGGFRLKTLAS